MRPRPAFGRCTGRNAGTQPRMAAPHRAGGRRHELRPKGSGRLLFTFHFAYSGNSKETVGSRGNNQLERNGRRGSLILEPAERWTAHKADELYDVASWGKGYFSVGENGNVWVHPDKDPARRSTSRSSSIRSCCAGSIRRS